MANRIKHFGIALGAATAVLGAVSCSDDDKGPDTRYAVLYDVVEYLDQTANGTRFSLYAPDAEDCVTLTSSSPLDMGELEPGKCLLLAYVPCDGKAYISGTVNVRAIGAVTNDKLMKGPAESLADWDRDEVWLTSLWRAGGFIVTRIQLVYDPQPRQFRLVVDEETIDDEYPDAYLVNIRKNDNENYMRQYYVAWDVSALWTYDYIKGLRVHVNNSNNTSLTTFVIEKPLRYTTGTGEGEIPDNESTSEE